jgi:hypothetical protein
LNDLTGEKWVNVVRNWFLETKGDVERIWGKISIFGGKENAFHVLLIC